MPDYYEFVIRGDGDRLEPYLAGFMAGAGLSPGFLLASEGVFHVSALRERITHRHEVSHVICAGPDRPKLRDAIKKAAGPFEFEIEDERRIARAYFHFEFDTPSREVAKRIQTLIGGLPAGVRAADYAPEESVDPDAKGTEVYSPAHEFRFRGKGVIEGDVRGVLAAHSALSQIDFTRCGEIDLHHTD